MEQTKPRIRLFGVLFKAALLLVLFNLASIFISDVSLGKFSLYNFIFPGRERFPFGETRQAYNLSLFDLDAMFASHVLSGAEKTPDEYRVLLIGDSSVWGTLLTPQETLAGQLNARSITACGKEIRAYNLGYPTISLMKDLMVLVQARQYEPDMIIWLTTLEAFPRDKQFDSPIVANNVERIRELMTHYQLPMDPNHPDLVEPSTWDQTFVSQRRALADLFRLQFYGVLWASTGIDQVYPEDYQRAQIDLEPDEEFHGLGSSQEASLKDALAFEVLDAGISAAAAPTILVNEPMLVSSGLNSEIRYNFFYPRWAYDAYRQLLAEHAAARGWIYLDLWDLVPPEEFTNSAIHLTPEGEALLSLEIARAIQINCQ
ncbi:MAG TPA: SGNH/GDSL hydrolase family protein [Anaerolineales bacterium]|nr:SGNH/GDSL hydrolase family protein [Anaerolineales bacterium]